MTTLAPTPSDPAPELDQPVHAIQIRPRQPGDFLSVIELMKRVYLPPHVPEAIWSERTLREHFLAFPEGQILAVAGDGRIVGDSTGMRVSLERAASIHTWSELTGRGTLGTHDPVGKAFYGVDIVVDPAFRGMGIASRIYQARFQTARAIGCTVFVAGARIPGYHAVAEGLSPRQYVRDVEAGLRFDPTLSRQLHLGFKVLAVLPRYFPDYESRDLAVLIQKPL